LDRHMVIQDPACGSVICGRKRHSEPPPRQPI
jgi:hypothetical protein